MNNAVLNYYSTQLYFNKQKERRNFAVSGGASSIQVSAPTGPHVNQNLLQQAAKATKINKNDLEVLCNQYVEHSDDILKYVLKNKDKFNKRTNKTASLHDVQAYAASLKRKAVQANKKQSETTTIKAEVKGPKASTASDINTAMVGSFSDIMSHNLKSGADASIGGFLKDKTGRKTFDKLAKGNTAAFFKSSGKPGKMPNEYEAGLKNLSDALAKARDMKDAAQYNQAFKLLISQAYWLALYMNAKDNTLGEDNSNRIAKYIRNREATLKTWNNNTKVFLNSVSSGKPAVLKKLDTKTTMGDRLKATGNRIINVSKDISKAVSDAFSDSDSKKG